MDTSVGPDGAPAPPPDPPAPNFEGHDGRECGEHRTVGSYRAWCYDCQEWCYPASPCTRCEMPRLRAEVEQLRAQVERQHEINAGWSAYSDRKKAEREKHVEAFEDALGLEHAGRGYWYERMIKAATDVRIERDALKTSVLAALAESRRWWEGGRTMGEVREGLALEAVEAQLRAALPEAS